MANSRESFLVALRDVAEAQSSMQKVAKAAGVNRENLYRALSKDGDPGLSTLDSVLNALGIEFKFVTKQSVIDETVCFTQPTNGLFSLMDVSEVTVLTPKTNYETTSVGNSFALEGADVPEYLLFQSPADESTIEVNGQYE